MKKLMNRAGLLAAAFALALAVALALNAAGQTPATAQVPAATQTPVATHTPAATQTPEATQTPTAGSNASVGGSDTDGNGLIEIGNANQLNAMRYDLDGNGVLEYDLNADGIPDISPDKQNTYNALISCPPTTAECKGYELNKDISLADLSAEYKPWTAIGPSWQSVFDGNGFSITGLEGQHGLFGNIGTGVADKDAKTVVKNVDVVGADITLCGSGVLATTNYATIIGSYVTGKITCSATTYGNSGGLVGVNRGTIIASVADVEVKLTNIPADSFVRVGGFAGINHGNIRRSYAYGDVIDSRAKGVRDAHSAHDNGFRARGFAVNHGGHGGKIYSSFSYGNKIVTNDRDKSEHPATFAYRSDSSRATDLTPGSCELDRQWKFTFAQSKCATD